MTISMQKEIKDIIWSFPPLLLIKESFNQIEWETQQATHNQKAVVSGATFPLTANSLLRYHLILSRDIDD